MAVTLPSLNAILNLLLIVTTTTMVFIKRLKKAPKPSKGREKTEIKKIANKSSQQVTFSKQWSELLKKASELCMLCDAHIIVRSPVYKTVCFSHPSVGSVNKRYLASTEDNDKEDELGGGLFANSEGSDNVQTLQATNRQYEDLLRELEREKNRRRETMEEGSSHKREKKAMNGCYWWDELLVDEMALEELEQCAAAIEKLNQKVGMKADDLRTKSLHQPSVAADGAAEVDGGLSNAATAASSSHHLVHDKGSGLWRWWWPQPSWRTW